MPAKTTKPATARKKTTKSKIKKPTSKAKAKPAAKVSETGDGLWLFKSEPNVFSWDHLKAKGKMGEEWDGVRNYQARNNMRAMKIGDLGFFYHSNEGKEVVGICEVCALAHPDSTTEDERWECVDVRAVRGMPNSVTLADVKANPTLANMALVTSMRLSVQPVRAAEWKEICRMGGLDPKTVRKSK